MGPTPPILVAVVSWNTRELLDACLTSLRDDARAGRASVWVVDNASTDGSAQMVAERHPGVHVIASEENLGYGRAINRVAREAPAGWEWIVPANADIEVEPGALERLQAAGREDPRAGALAPRLVLPDGQTQHSPFGFPTVPYTLAFALGLPRVVPGLADRMCLEGSWDPDRPRRVPWAIAALLLVRAQAWREIDGFDERQFMYAEDLDLGWRLHQAGWHTRYVPDARVRHVSAASTTQAWGAERVDRHQAATYAWMLRRRGAALTRVVAIINLAGAVAWWAATAARVRVTGDGAYRRDEWRRWIGRHRAGLWPRERLDRAS